MEPGTGTTIKITAQQREQIQVAQGQLAMWCSAQGYSSAVGTVAAPAESWKTGVADMVNDRGEVKAPPYPRGQEEPLPAWASAVPGMRAGSRYSPQSSKSAIDFANSVRKMAVLELLLAGGLALVSLRAIQLSGAVEEIVARPDASRRDDRTAVQLGPAISSLGSGEPETVARARVVGGRLLGSAAGALAAPAPSAPGEDIDGEPGADTENDKLLSP